MTQYILSRYTPSKFVFFVRDSMEEMAKVLRKEIEKESLVASYTLMELDIQEGKVRAIRNKKINFHKYLTLEKG